MIKNDIRIGFVVYQNVVKDEVASTRFRVTWPAKYTENFIVSDNFKVLSQCAVVVFQTRIDNPDVDMAKKLKENGAKIIFDFTDPHWIKEYDPGAVHPVFYRIAEVADLITLPTLELARTFKETFADCKIEIIPDRLDLELYNKIKTHKDADKYTILWHGSYGNICSLDLARQDLEKLSQQFKIKLLCIYDKSHKYKIKPISNIEIETREWSNDRVIKGLLESDVSINPKYDNWKSYKSNNKTVTAWALGIPCVERNFYSEIGMLLKSAELRNKLASKLRAVVIRDYDVKDTARQWIEIAKTLTKNSHIAKRKNIVVYTSICGSFDGLREDQLISESADYIAFLDSQVSSNTWQIRQVQKQFIDPCRQAKIYKVMPWQFLAEYDYSIWLDGTMAIKADAVELIEKFLKGFDIAIFKHAVRDDIYEENNVDLTVRKKEPKILRDKLVEKYRRENIGNHTGLFECGVIIRRHTEAVKRLCETWWAEISAFSSSDQIPFIYALSKHNVKVNPIVPGHIYNNPYFQYVFHGQTWQHTFKNVSTVVKKGQELIIKDIKELQDIPTSNIFIKEKRENEIYVLTKDGKKFYFPTT